MRWPSQLLNELAIITEGKCDDYNQMISNCQKFVKPQDAIELGLKNAFSRCTISPENYSKITEVAERLIGQRSRTN